MLIENKVANQISSKDYLLTRMLGNSMFPFLNDKDKVIVSKNRSVKKLDVIVYFQRNKYIISKVISINDDSVVVKADNETTSYTIPKSLTIGKVESKQTSNRMRKINTFMNIYYYTLTKLKRGNNE